MAIHDHLVEMCAVEGVDPHSVHPRAADDHRSAVRHGDDRDVLVHPEAVELVVEPHALPLIGGRAGPVEQLLDLLVEVERPAASEEAAEDAVRVGEVGRPA